MGRPTTKAALLAQNQESFDTLMQLVDSIAPTDQALAGVNGSWSVKDVLAHLVAWQDLLDGWYQQEQTGGQPHVPAQGYSWSQMSQLNEKIFREHRHDPSEHVRAELRRSHERLQKMVAAHSEEQLFAKQRYAWTGSTSMGSHIAGCSASHYQWAIELIRKWLRSRKRQAAGEV